MTEIKNNVILGIDTHKHTHTVAVISSTGLEMDSKQFEANSCGFKKAYLWASEFGVILRAGIESTGSYGAGISRYLTENDIKVYDVYAPDRLRRYRSGKDDSIDAYSAAEAALSYTRCTPAKDHDDRTDALRMMETSYSQLVKQHTASINTLKAELVTLPNQARERLEALSTKDLIKTCARVDTSKAFKDLEHGVRFALSAMARTLQALDKEISVLDKEIARLAKELLPHTVALQGVGHHGAVKFLSAIGTGIDRLSGEAAFAMACGVSPVPVSSGNKHHFRLNRGGNRQANSALHFMALTRMRLDERTKAFITKKTSEGKSKKDAMRALKRYLAREVFGALKADLNALKAAA